MPLKLYLDNPEIGTKFDAARAGLPGADKDWLSALRRGAMGKFIDRGLPGPKVEEWKYTNLGFLVEFLANENFSARQVTECQAEAKALFEAAYIDNIAGPTVVFVNGHFNGGLSTCPGGAGVKFAVFSENPDVFRQGLTGSEPVSPLNELNRAMARDGYHLDVDAGVTLAQPIQIIHVATSGTEQQSQRMRAQIRLGAGAKARLIESFIGASGVRYWSHLISDVDLAKGAELAHFQFQRQGKQAIHMTEQHSIVAEKAKFSHMSLQLGAEISRTELVNSFTGENAEVELRGAYLGRGRQAHDITTRINHDQPNCQSNQLFRGVLDEGGKSAFQGKVVVAQDAQKTNADQSNKNLLLSRKAEANIKPELLIYADDVKCTHGATVGELDSDQLFYLLSRGMDEITAKSLLVEAFLAEVFDEETDEILRQKFKEKTAGWLNTGGTS